MPAKPTVSIVLPAKDAAGTLGRALESMLGQSLTDFELLLVDDHSNDATRDIAASFAKSDSRIRILSPPPPGGLIPALRKGTASAIGRFIARMDADDVSRPDRLKQQVDLLESDPGLAACGCRVHAAGVLGEGMERYVAWSNALLSTTDIERERFVESPLVHPSMVMRAEAFRAVGGYREMGWPEDYDLWLRMIEGGMRIGKHPDVLLDWHDREHRMTRADPRYGGKRFLKAKAHFLNRLPGSGVRGFAICGAGPIGKRLARYLLKEGAAIRAFYEVHPRRVGEIIHGVPVFHHSRIPAPENSASGADSPFLLSAIGQPIGRKRLRNQVSSLGYREGIDFFAVA